MPTTQMNDPATASFGTQIQVLTSAAGVTPQTFETIPGVSDIDGPTRSVSETETTSHSTGIPVRTFIPSLIDPGQLSFPCYFNPSDPLHSASSPYGMEALFEGRVVTDFRLINTDAGRRTRQFKGFVSELSESYPVEGVNTRDTTIRISGLMQDVMPEVTLLPTSASPLAAGGPATVAVTVDASSGGYWFPVSDSPWITIQSPTSAQSGNGTINYTVAAQTGAAPERVGKITVAGVDFVITQAAGV